MKKLTAWQVFRIFLKLGLTSFGGPVAHLGYFRDEFVSRRKLLQESSYADLVALCQFLPGPASSQVGIGIGISQSGLRGGLAAWCGFTLPSAILLILFAYGVSLLDEKVVQSGWLHGLKVVAVAVVAQAVWGMAQKLCPDLTRKIVSILAAVFVFAFPGVSGQLTAIFSAALFGLFCLRQDQPSTEDSHLFFPSRTTAAISLSLMFILLLGLPLLARSGFGPIQLFDSFFRSGALVFGGGHVVLPLLQAEVVNPGWIGKDLFLAGYGAAQAVPGPLFTFSAYLGSAQQLALSGWVGGLLCLLAIFTPSFLLLFGILPFWNDLRKNPHVRSALLGINAAVVGLLLAAFIDPVCSSGILSFADLLLALAAFTLLARWKLPPWLVVGLTGLGGAVLFYFFG
ncbi:chromate transporter [Malonomonas rubra DSM 5091]|uniref:Chromate transporter n=1 Tax=Malonomonas rubra DSM 5091 TaxID=1122189 RepID=A0A1M6ML64_MALRU|nr:chromate efflux transporter [Malonomonas rubra]SHJ84146.1 chromate transporter [Malonomonas rubra DSM 5091]